MSEPLTSPARLRTTVTAIVVGPADSPYLAQTLAALGKQNHSPDRVVVVDVGRAGRPGEAAQTPEGWLHVQALGAENFGAAVRAALRDPAVAAEETDWLWLLHDDSAPSREALAELLRGVEDSRTVAVAGCKQVDWKDPARIVSVGVSATRGGSRFTGIEDGEVDQGQHDGVEDVYAVGTAGMLVDAGVWAALHGPDPVLGPFGDGVDLSRRARLAGHRVIVVPTAVVRHARAGHFGARRAHAPADSRRSYRARRVAQLYGRMTQAPALLTPLVALAALLVAPLRALWRVVNKDLRLALDELVAPLAMLRRSGAIAKARRRARATATLPASRLAPLYTPASALRRARRERRLQASAERRSTRTPSELEMRERAALALRRRSTYAVVALLGLGAAGLLAGRAFAGPLMGGALLPEDSTFIDLWHAAASPWLAAGDGQAGPPDPFLLVLGVLSALTGGPLGVPVRITVALLIALAVPLAATTAWFAAGAATRSLGLRAWAALTWAFGPPLLLAVTGGRLGPLVAHVLLPLVPLALARAFGVDRRDVIVSGLVGAKRVSRAPQREGVSAAEARRRRLAALAAVAEDQPTGRIDAVLAGAEGEPAIIPIPSNTAEPYEGGDDEPPAGVVTRASGVGSLGAAAGAGLALAGVAAGAPVLGVLGLAILVALVLLLPRGLPNRARLLLSALPTIALLGPLAGTALREPDGWRVLLGTPGAPLDAAPAPFWGPLLGWPAQIPGSGLLAVTSWLGLVGTGVALIAALVALLRGGGKVRAVRIGWLVAALGAAAAALIPGVLVALATGADGDWVQVRAWAGGAVSLALLGLVLAACTGLEGIRPVLTGHSFGWRQLALGAFTVLLALGAVGSVAVTGSVLAAATPAWGVRTGTPVPAVAEGLQNGPERSRVLALGLDGGVLDVRVWRANGPQLQETSTLADLRRLGAAGKPDAADAELAAAAAALQGRSDAASVDVLARHAVSIVVVPPTDATVLPTTRTDGSARADLIAALDATAGLERVTANDATGVVWRVVPAGGALIARALLVADGQPSVLLASDLATVEDHLDGADTARTVVLAERADTAWHAWLDGRALRSVPQDWRQAFEVPAGESGHLVIRYEPAGHTPWRVAGLVILALTALLAVPVRRRRLEDDL